MDRNLFQRTSQQRKLQVRLVRACGSKRRIHTQDGGEASVRLVRACGSKLTSTGYVRRDAKVRLVRACGSKQTRELSYPTNGEGQARKSLWIETLLNWGGKRGYIGQARKSLWIETCRVRRTKGENYGQARKSLWIETVRVAIRLYTQSRSGS